MFINFTQDHSVLLTQIVLEHTRKFTYLSDDGDETHEKLPLGKDNTLLASTSTPVTPLVATAGEGIANFFHHVDKIPISSFTKDSVQPLEMGMNSKHQFNKKSKKK